ncbi:MAG: hypothetical protein Q4D90_00240 [bacterium]|nr:hypothetical protein [bacterium]
MEKKISKRIYDEILDKCHIAPPEMGGYIGEKNGIIDKVVFDVGIQSKEKATYIPDSVLLNQTFQIWNEEKIEFCGIFHTHLSEQRCLSVGDKEYIKRIMAINKNCLKSLYFPIVIPKQEILLFLAIWDMDNLRIVKVPIKII